MPTELKRLKIDRVDLVPEGANSAAFVTLYKGKEMKSMDANEILDKLKPEHADVIKSAFAELEKQKKQAEEEAAAAKQEAANAKQEAADAKAQAADGKKPAPKSTEDEDEDETNKACEGRKKTEKKGEQPVSGKPSDAAKAKEGTTSFDESETLTKGLDPQVAAYIEQIRKQKEVAEEAAREAIAKERHLTAINKAAELKALPIAEDQLVSFIEKSSDETVDMLTAIAKGIEGTVLTESGVSTPQTFHKSSSDAWQRIEKAAQQLASERNISVAKATGDVVKEHPELYKEYLEGGAN